MILAPERIPISLDKLKRFMEFESILRECGWTIACLKCRNPISGDNATDAMRISVKCQCQERYFDAGGTH